MAKAATWPNIDAHTRERGDQTGLDTLVVHAVNDENWPSGPSGFGGVANALSSPPGEYGRKAKTQMN